MTSLGIEHNTTGLNNWLRDEFDLSTQALQDYVRGVEEYARELEIRLGIEGGSGLGSVEQTALDGMRRAFEASMDAERAANEAYRYTLTHDRLTGLLNIQEMEAIVEQRLAQEKPTGVFVIDLDSFKPLNDRVGHIAGDGVLQKLSNYLREVVYFLYKRQDDAVAAQIARWGGDEFVIAVDLAGGEKRTREGETIHDRMERELEYLQTALGAFFQNLPSELGDIELGATIGYAVWDPADSSRHWTANETIRQADSAMNRAKRRDSR